MKFLVDAQLPYRLKVWLLNKGFDAIHTFDLPAQNLSSDTDISQVTDAEDGIVISKDSDFLKLHVLRRKPARLLMITTGNIINQ
jgi:predicted nuclease of predicted toxin-antitoxin system